MIRVGVTGGIGAGKSVVCNIFQVLGIPVYNADARAKELMTTDKELIEKIKTEFGEPSYDVNGNLNRTYLAEKVFGNKDQLTKLNQLVHPVVGMDFDHWSKQCSGPYVIKEAALLIESGSYKELDYLILVTAPEKTRIERVLLRDEHRDRKQVEQILQNQYSDQKKKKLADFLINNDESHPILAEVLEIHNLIAHKAPKIS